ncbi:hypothetical protein MRS44_004962 [Fusarium solani]|uniref:uncharacterized protein n=1 Tax=Fusarium solani TaxID=169388 RepID=UPI0032C4A3F9|nr:hypothetical protein MRS44_004962 [Fusarium solani]
MDHRSRIRERSPRREHGSRDRRDRRSRDSRSRSRSPAHKRTKTSSWRHERHSTEPSGHHSSSRHRHREHASRAPVTLPFDARQLAKGDLGAFRPLFADYLDLQKQKDIEEMDEREIRGRWKSFIGKWNRGELAEGWYDPEMFARIAAQNQGAPRASHSTARRDEREERVDDNAKGRDDNSEEDDDDDYGPTLPTSDPTRRSGPGIPTLQDLSLRAELTEEDKQASIADLRAARKADRAVQRERLDELVPRAEPGTRERMLEKQPRGHGGEQRARAHGGGDSLEEYKQAKQQEQRRKTEREIRREEIERAKREEIEEKRRAWREREEGTIGMLKELARQRFG